MRRSPRKVCRRRRRRISRRAPELPAIYRAVDALRPGAILVELPFGDPWYDVRYMFFSTTHRRRLLNGYSGIFPPSFRARQRVLSRPLLDPGASAQAIGGATHVVVHRPAWKDDTGARRRRLAGIVWRHAPHRSGRRGALRAAGYARLSNAIATGTRNS